MTMTHASFAFDRKSFDAATVCDKCRGSGKAKRGNGRCKACDGRGEAGLSHPRIEFNHGYHDARHDARSSRVRTIIAKGEHTTKSVSLEFSYWYAAGYAFGLRDWAAPKTSSEPAWLDFAGFSV